MVHRRHVRQRIAAVHGAAQTALLGGYAFSHLSLHHLGIRRQPWVQLGVVVAGVVVLPLAAPLLHGWTRLDPEPGDPSWTDDRSDLLRLVRW